MAKNYVPIFYDWPKVTKNLNAEEKGRLIDAIVLYAQGKECESILQGNERFLFPAFSCQIDRENESGENKSKAAEIREERKRQEAQQSTTEDSGAQKAQTTTKSTTEHKNANNNNNKNNNNNEDNNKNKNENEKENEKENPPEGGKKNGAPRQTKQPDALTLARFEAFWGAYPRHQDKAKALKAFQRINPDTDLLTIILRALEVQKDSDQWTCQGGQYIPLATTWLNGRRWEDEPPGGGRPRRTVTAARYSQRDYTEEELAGLAEDPILKALEGAS